MSLFKIGFTSILWSGYFGFYLLLPTALYGIGSFLTQATSWRLHLAALWSNPSTFKDNTPYSNRWDHATFQVLFFTAFLEFILLDSVYHLTMPFWLGAFFSGIITRP